MTEKLTVYVDVDGTPSHADDEGVAGRYAVTVTLKEGVVASDLSQKELAEVASAVKDEFHERIGIEVLDDFEITLSLEDETVIDDDDFEAETDLVVWTEFGGQVGSGDAAEPDVDALVGSLDEMQAKAVLAGLMGALVELGFHRDGPISGGDCVDAMSTAFRSAMDTMASKAG